MSYGAKVPSEDEVVEVLRAADPPADVFTLRKKLLRYTRSLNATDKEKYENDLYYI